MKQFMVILAVVLLTGCQQIDAFMDGCIDQYNKKYYKTSLYYGDFSMIKSVNKIGVFIINNIHYKFEVNGNYVQSPYETLSLGTGDCEDFALLYMNILYVRFGIKSELIFVDSKDVSYRTVENGELFDHCMVRLADGTIVEPQNGFYYSVEVQYSYTFDEIFMN